MMRTITGIGMLLTALAFPLASNAHHAMDPMEGTPVELKGTIEFISWDGAHVMYRVRTHEPSGDTKLWEILGASPKILSSRRIAKSTMNVGEDVTVTGTYNSTSKMVAPYYFTTVDGHKYEMGFYPPAAGTRRNR